MNDAAGQIEAIPDMPLTTHTNHRPDINEKKEK